MRLWFYLYKGYTMLNMLFSNTRRMIALTGVGLFAANCLMADVLPYQTHRRPRPIPMEANPSSQQPVRPYIQHMDPAQPKDPVPMIATMYGKLIYLDRAATPDANYALYRKVDEKIVPVCFIKWDGSGWEKYAHQDVRVTGFVRKMKGWTCPLLIVGYPENIEFAHQEEQPQPPAPVFMPAEQTIAEPLPPPQTATPLPPPPPPADPQPSPVQERTWISPSSSNYKPTVPKAADPLRLYR
jgi:hypothetical protein